MSGSEAALLRRLSVFPSEMGLDAVEAVATQTGIEREFVLEILSSLIEKSFVTRVGSAANARYRLHETMREYALIKLRDADEKPAAIEAFVTYYADLCQVAEKAAQTTELIAWLKRVDVEADNLRAALAHCLRGPDHATGLSMVGSLLWYWTARATSEGAYWLDLYLEHRGGDFEDDAAMTRALFARGYVSMVLGDQRPAHPCRHRRRKGSRGTCSPARAILSVSAGINVISGELARARSQLREAQTLAQALTTLLLTRCWRSLRDSSRSASWMPQPWAASTPRGTSCSGSRRLADTQLPALVRRFLTSADRSARPGRPLFRNH